MTVDRILQLKLIADVGDISRKMGTVEQDVGKATQAFNTLKGFAVPAMIGLGSTITSNVVGAIGEAIAQAGMLREELVGLDSLSVSLGLDEGGARATLDALTSEAQKLGFGDEVAIAQGFKEALAVTEDVDKAISIVRAGMDLARFSGEDLGEAIGTAMDTVVAGGEEAEEKLGVFGETAEARLDAFNAKYGNFAEDFALTDEGEWQTINAEFDGFMMDLATVADEGILEIKRGILDGIEDWKYIFEEAGPILEKAFKTIWDGLANLVKAPINAVLGALEGALNFIGDAFFGAIEEIRKNLNPVAFIGDHIPDDPITWGGVSVPRLAEGGIVTDPTLAVVGEGRYDEAIIPLDGDHGLGGITVNVYVAPLSDPAEVGRKVVEAIQRYESRAGKSWRAA